MMVLAVCEVHCCRTSVSAAASEVSVVCVVACWRLCAVRALPAAPPRRSSRSSLQGSPCMCLSVVCC